MSIPFLGSVLAFAQVVMAQYEGEEIPQGDAGQLPNAGKLDVVIPTPILLLLALAFIGAMAVAVTKILDSERARENKKNKKAIAAATGTGSKKGSKKTQ